MTRKFSITLPTTWPNYSTTRRTPPGSSPTRCATSASARRPYVPDPPGLYHVTDEGVARMHTRLPTKRRAIAAKVAAGEL